MVAEAVEPEWTFGGTWPYEPRWFRTSDGVTLHYVDEGARDGQPVVMVHGQPTWSYLYRHFIAGVTEAGFRAVAHDHMGFGRSDKPPDESAYTIQRHAKNFGELMDHLGLDGVTLVGQDWGGPIMLAWAVDHPGRVRRLVILNTFAGLSMPDYSKPPAMFRVIRARGVGDFLVRRLQIFTRVFVFRGTQKGRVGANERAAYLAPHRTPDSRAGVMAFPRLIPWGPDSPTRQLGERIEATLSALADKPVLVCWPTKDPAFKRNQLAWWRDRFPDAEVHEIEAGHYIQEDAHEQVVPLLVDWLRRT